MLRLATAAATVAIIAAAVAAPAAAQVAGTYTGTAADGSYVSFQVNANSGGDLQVHYASFSYKATCGDGSTLYPNWGFGVDQPIVDGRISYTDAASYLTLAFSMRFAANGKEATGKFYAYNPTLSPIGAHPTKAKLCTSPQQTFTVTHVKGSAATDPALSPNDAVSREKRYHASVGPRLDD